MSKYKYGLIGEKLSHSFSKPIHEKITSHIEGYKYDLIEIKPENLTEFFTKKEFSGVNVTIPYKEDVFQYLDEVDTKALDIGACNTILNKDGKLYGYNTDFDGFIYLLERCGQTLADKNVLILGTGGTCKTVLAVAKSQKAKSITIVSRNPSKAEGEQGVNQISYEEAIKLEGVEILINTTPSGMYPNTTDRPIDLSHFKDLEFVADVIYNPFVTALLLQAKKLGIPCENGMSMLVAQAKYADDIFTATKIDNAVIEEILLDMTLNQLNIALIGMPSCGKSTLARHLAKLTGKELVDIDTKIVEKYEMQIPDIFEKYGESTFREYETAVVNEYSKGHSCVIATGGGVVENEINIDYLSQNSIVVFINCPIDLLLTGGGRPLSSSPDAIQKLYDRRFSLYQKYSHIEIANDKSLPFEEIVSKIYDKIISYYKG